MAHPLRLRILSLLTGSALTAAEVARELGITHANASYHLRHLLAAGTIEIAGEERIRGGTAKRYRYDLERDLNLSGKPRTDPEAWGARQRFYAAVADELRRRARRIASTPHRAHDAHLRECDSREAVGDDRQAGHAERHGSHRRIVVQGHLEPLVRVLVVHVVDDVHGVDVHARQPVHHPLELLAHVVELEVVTLDRRCRRRDLVAADLVAPAVDRIQQALRQVGARAEELHLLADQHRGDTAGDRAVVAPGAAHDLVALELDRARIDRDPG